MASFDPLPRQLPRDLDQDADVLATLGVYDVIIGRAAIGDEELWQAVVTLGGRGYAYSYCWMLEPRATAADARGAAVCFLHGLVAAHDETIERWPPVRFPGHSPADVYRAQQEAYRDGLERAWPDVAGHWRAFGRGP